MASSKHSEHVSTIRVFAEGDESDTAWTRCCMCGGTSSKQNRHDDCMITWEPEWTMVWLSKATQQIHAKSKCTRIVSSVNIICMEWYWNRYTSLERWQCFFVFRGADRSVWVYRISMQVCEHERQENLCFHRPCVEPMLILASFRWICIARNQTIWISFR